ncbi:UrcA family protein [Flavisphingomonas formosensis]|uniref:UrcA family protein n=1 Tax=Flavisphingomonas formosensis TaxID=861534 RepID=UPI0012FA38BF|nr:UrcA family protein [Sphingomonas formosensis]
MIRIISAAAVAAAFVCSATIAPAMAQDVPTRTVSFADLDLSQAGGQAELRHRIHRAALDMCGNLDVRDLTMTREVTRCRTEASRSADSQFATIISKAKALAQEKRDRTIEVAGR